MRLGREEGNKQVSACWQPRTQVADLNQHARIEPPPAQHHLFAAARLYRITQQVDEHLLQLVAIATQTKQWTRRDANTRIVEESTNGGCSATTYNESRDVFA
jgi:hypothetical protein